MLIILHVPSWLPPNYLVYTIMFNFELCIFVVVCHVTSKLKIFVEQGRSILRNWINYEKEIRSIFLKRTKNRGNTHQKKKLHWKWGNKLKKKRSKGNVIRGRQENRVKRHLLKTIILNQSSSSLTRLQLFLKHHSIKPEKTLKQRE